MKIVIFGAGAFGREYIEKCPVNKEIVAVCDNNWEKIMGNTLLGYKVISPENLSQLEFDRVVIAIDEHSKNGVHYITQIREQLLHSLPIEKIMLMSKDRGNEVIVKYPRVEFLRNLSDDFRQGEIGGNVAECGVCWGDYAVKINEFFPNKKLYLFDTFTSFDDRDLNQETGNFSTAIEARSVLATANPELVFLKMPYKQNCIIKQGYVPDTFIGLENERFCFVNLDMDLYAPTLAGLRFFADKMVAGGIILVHDYYLASLDGVKRAVLEFANEHTIVKTPIGDKLSVAITIL